VTALDTRARATALRALNKYGKAVTFKHRAPGTYNTATSTSTPTETTATPKILITSPSKEQLQAGVLATSEVAMVAAAAFAIDPRPGDQVTVDGKVHTVGWTDRLWSGEQVALWWLELKS
jgi:hypothetical protein